MAKKIQALVKLQCPAGAATPAPPVGTALGPHGVNIMEFVKQFNARTQSQSGMVIPCVVTIYADRTFTFITKTPPAPNLLLKEAGVEKGSGQPNRTKVGKVTRAQVKKIAEIKMADLNAVRPRQRHAHDRRHRPVHGIGRGGLMAAQGKKFQTAAATVDRSREYQIPEAVALVKGASFAKFDETVDVAVRLGVDPRHADQVVRGTVVLPHGTGKPVRVLVITQGERVREAEAAGADFVGIEYIQKLKDGWLECDVIVATPDVMGQLGQLGRVLGPRGLMPNPKAGTVTMDVGKAVREIKAGKIEFRVDKTGNVHAPVGKVSFTPAQLADNVSAFMDTIVRAKPSAAKGTYIRSATISSTMGPGVRLDTAVYR